MQGPNYDHIKAHVVDSFVRDEMNVHNFQTLEKTWVRKWANDTFKWHDDYDQDPKYRGREDRHAAARTHT